MIITREFIDIVAPTHGRTSCNDDYVCNGDGGWTGKYNRDTGKKEIRLPRCTRCYLLLHCGEDTDSLEFFIEAHLSPRDFCV